VIARERGLVGPVPQKSFRPTRPRRLNRPHWDAIIDYLGTALLASVCGTSLSFGVRRVFVARCQAASFGHKQQPT